MLLPLHSTPVASLANNAPSPSLSPPVGRGRRDEREGGGGDDSRVRVPWRLKVGHNPDRAVFTFAFRGRSRDDIFHGDG